MAIILTWIAQAASVFAHFMVTNSGNYKSDDWKNDMKLAQDAHIDAFALNAAYNVWGVTINASQTTTSTLDMTSSIDLPGIVHVLPEIGGGGGSSSGGSDGSNGNEDEDECSTRTAQICSTVCVDGFGCDFHCTTTTGCTATASSTKTIGTPPPGVAITMEQWPAPTDDPEAATSIAISLDLALSSLFGSLTVIEGPSATPTGPAPSDGAHMGFVQIFYYNDQHTDESQYEVYEGYDGVALLGNGDVLKSQHQWQHKCRAAQA